MDNDRLMNFTSAGTILLDYLKEMPMLYTPDAELSKAEANQVKMQLTDGCPGRWEYYCLGGSHVFELRSHDQLLDVVVQVNEVDGKRTFELCVDALFNSIISLREFDDAFEAAKFARPLVYRSQEMLQELRQMAEERTSRSSYAPASTRAIG